MDRGSCAKERTNQPEGRDGGKCLIKTSPAASPKPGNPTKGGGINRSTNPTSQR